MIKSHNARGRVFAILPGERIKGKVMESIFEIMDLVAELMTDYDAEPVAFRVTWEDASNEN